MHTMFASLQGSRMLSDYQPPCLKFGFQGLFSALWMHMYKTWQLGRLCLYLHVSAPKPFIDVDVIWCGRHTDQLTRWT